MLNNYTVGPSHSLGTQKWETPLGKVIEGMENVRNFNSDYGDGPPFGKGPAQGKIHSGRRYIEENFPLLDYFKACTVERGVTPVEVKKWTEPKRIRDEHQHENKHHKKKFDSVPRLNDTRKQFRRSDTMTHMFAVFAIIVLVILLVFGYRRSGRKGAKKS